MTPDEPEGDRTQLQPPGAGGRTVAFDKTAVYAAPPPLAAPAPAHDMGNGLPIGTRLGEFELVKLLGEGGFGIVYLAHDHSLQRRVALKEYMPSSLAQRTLDSQVQVRSERYRETFEAGRKSFINEAHLLAQFDHPSLVKVYRFWEANGTAYMVMPFYEGKNLRDTLRASPQAPDEHWLRTLLLPLTEALLVIHAEQCYHRDIAPDNVMMLAGSNRPLLLDFGAARRVIGDMTQALTVILKPGYAPVEQYAEIPGMKQGSWTDVYALAAVVHYAITGRTPPPSVGRLLGDTYQPLAQVAAGRYSEPFLAAIDHALAVRPDQRIQTITQFRHELGLDQMVAPSTVMTLAQPGGAPPMPPPPSPPPSPFTQASADAATQALTAMPRTAYVPPAAPLPTVAAPPVQAAPAAAAAAPAAAAPAGNSRMLVGAGVGVLLLGALGFGGWRMLAAPSSLPPPAQAPVQTAAQTPAQTPAPPAPAVAVAPAATTPAAAAPTVTPLPARFEPEREFDRILQAQSNGFGVRAQAVKTELSIARKDEFRFRVSADRDGFVYVVGLSPDGSLALLVPNASTPTVRVRKGQAWNFPPTRDGFYIPAVEPPGLSRVLVMVSARERRFDAMQPKQEGPIQLFATGDQASAIAAQFKGGHSPLAGQPQCPAVGECADEYGAALMKFETRP